MGQGVEPDRRLGVLAGETDIGEAGEYEAEYGAGVFSGLQASVGAELVDGTPRALFERGGGGVFLGGAIYCICVFSRSARGSSVAEGAGKESSGPASVGPLWVRGQHFGFPATKQ